MGSFVEHKAVDAESRSQMEIPVWLRTVLTFLTFRRAYHLTQKCAGSEDSADMLLSETTSLVHGCTTIAKR